MTQDGGCRPKAGVVTPKQEQPPQNRGSPQDRSSRPKARVAVSERGVVQDKARASSRELRLESQLTERRYPADAPGRPPHPSSECAISSPGAGRVVEYSRRSRRKGRPAGLEIAHPGTSRPRVSINA